MRAEDIVILLQMIHARNIELSYDGQWVKSSCPFATFAHVSGTDDHPSFGIKVSPGGRSDFNCFSGETRVLTKEGHFPIRDLVGKVPTLLTTGGEWIKAPVVSFGVQPLKKLTLQRNRRKKEIYCTGEHRWFIRYGNGRVREVVTDQLIPKHRLCYTIPKKPELSPINGRLWVSRGFVFGDGSRQYRHSTAYFCGDKDKSMVKYFREYWPNNITGSFNISKMHGLPYSYKDLPSLDSNLDFLYSWLQGYFAADGCVDTYGRVILASSKKENLEFCRVVSNLLGIGTYGITEQKRVGYGKYPTSLFFLRFLPSTLTKEFFLLPKHKDRFVGPSVGRFRWSVVSVEDSDRNEEVFCAVVPETHSFVLEDNILTGNCFSCGTGSLSLLIHRLTWTVGLSPSVHKFFMEKELFLREESDDQFYIDYKDIINKAVPKSVPVPIPTEVLNDFPLLSEYSGFEYKRAKEWFAGRNIDFDVAVAYQTRLCPDRRAIIFPIIDDDSQTYLLHVRSRINKSFYYLNPINTGYKDLVWGRSDFWYGISFVDFKGPVILVESETDLLRLLTLGIYNVIASCGPVGTYKLSRVSSPKVYLGFDSDLGGAKYCMTTLRYLGPNACLYRLKWSIIGKKDAGDLDSYDEFVEVWDKREAISLCGNSLEICPLLYEDLLYSDLYSKGKEVVLS